MFGAHFWQVEDVFFEEKQRAHVLKIAATSKLPVPLLIDLLVMVVERIPGALVNVATELERSTTVRG